MNRLTPVNKVGLTGQVLEKIRNYIDDAGFPPGTKLPSEREFAERLGVSRGITREALKALQAMGVVDIRVGDGTYVAVRDYGALFDHITGKMPLSLEDSRCLLESRMGFECAALELATQRVTDEELKRMEESIVRMERAPNLEEKVQADMDFHSILLHAAHNPIVAEMCGFLRWYFLKGIPTIGGVELDEGLLPELVRKDAVEHRAVLNALRERNSEVGRRMMTQHLASAIERNIGRLCERDASPTKPLAVESKEASEKSTNQDPPALAAASTSSYSSSRNPGLHPKKQRFRIQ